jgi:hypothetical protein
MRPRTSRSHRVPAFRARLAVEQYEDRIPVSESVGMGIALRALANAAEIRAVHPAAPPILRMLTERQGGCQALSPRRAC